MWCWRGGGGNPKANRYIGVVEQNKLMFSPRHPLIFNSNIQLHECFSLQTSKFFFNTFNISVSNDSILLHALKTFIKLAIAG